MVDQWTGKWTEEKDYSTYPKEKWCDCDYMAVWIREQGYKPKTSINNFPMIFIFSSGSSNPSRAFKNSSEAST